MKSPTTKRQAGPLQGITLLLPITMAVMGIVLLVPVLPEILKEFSGIRGSSYLVQMGVLTMPAGCVLVFSPLAGWLSDRYGRRPILIAAMFLYAFAGIAPIFLSNLWAIIATRVAVGMCEAVILTVTTTMISDYFVGSAREKWLASQTAVASMSALLLFPVAGRLGAVYGWRGPFWVYLVSLVLLIGVVLFTWEPTHEEQRSVSNVRFPWVRMLSICALTVFAAVMFYSFQTQAGIALDALGVHDPAHRGDYTTWASIGVPVGTVLFWIAARLPITLLLCLEFTLIGGSYLSMGHAATPGAFTAAAFLNQVGCGLVLPTMLTWATRGLAFEIRGRGNGMWQGAFAIGQFVSSGVVTLMATFMSGVLGAINGLGIAGLAAGALALFSYLAWGLRSDRQGTASGVGPEATPLSGRSSS
jgi:MFS family permease